MTNLIHKLGELVSGITLTRTYGDVAQVLEKLKNSDSKVVIKFQGDSKSYSSSVTAFNAKHKMFVLNDMQPAVSPATFRKGRKVTITAGNNDQAIELEGKYLEPLVANEELGFQMKVTSRLHSVESKSRAGREFNSMLLSQLSSIDAHTHGGTYAEM